MIPDRRKPDVFADVRKFIEVSAPERITPLGTPPDISTLKLIEHLINEEVNIELLPNLTKMIENGATLERMVQFLDDAIDSIYVLSWGIATMSLPGQAAWNEVQRANMSKFPLVTSMGYDTIMQHHVDPKPLDIASYKDIEYKITVRGDRFVITNSTTGKVMKPEGFTPPNIFGVVHGMLTIDKIKTMPDVIATPFMKDYFHAMEKRIEDDSNN